MIIPCVELNNNMAREFTFGKSERLKSRKSIDQLFSEGKKILAAPFRILYLILPQSTSPYLLFGIGVSSKNFKKAVDRNRIKRLTKEAWRLQKNDLQERLKATQKKLNVFFIYTGKDLPQYDDVYKKTGTILKKLDKLIE